MSHSNFPTTRLRRLRQHPRLRDMVRETQLSVNDLIYPLFIRFGRNQKIPVSSMPGCFQLSVDQLAAEIETIQSLQIPAVLLFGIPETKDPTGQDSYDDNGIIAQAIHTIKEIAPELLVIADTCFCEYTDHGHCGVIHETARNKDVANDETLALLVKQSLTQTRAGADIIAPSGMMDGMVAAIRKGLDENNFSHIPIMSYAAKFASNFYGPFREAAEGVPQFGDRKTYQMDPANGTEALRETTLDIQEGADIVMVKPAMPYLDVITNVKRLHPAVPLAAYQVSGEYAMLKAAAQNGWLDEKQTALESLTAIKRAGADLIITYFAKDAARWLGI